MKNDTDFLTHEQLEIYTHMGAAVFNALAADLQRLADDSDSKFPLGPCALYLTVRGNSGLTAFLDLVNSLDVNASAPFEHDDYDAEPEAEAAE